MTIKKINIETFEGNIPMGYDLVIFEEKESDLIMNPKSTARILYGFNEVGLYDSEFTNPTYGFLSN